MEIGDVSKEEALEYLKLRGVDDEEQAASIYELVGGRMIHLKSLVDGIKANITLEGMYTVYYVENGWFLTAFIAIRKQMFSGDKKDLASAEILPGHRYHKEGALIMGQLLQKESISEDTFYDLVGPIIARKLLETNIFSHHFSSQEITFQSTVMRRYCEAKRAYWSGGPLNWRIFTRS